MLKFFMCAILFVVIMIFTIIGVGKIDDAKEAAWQDYARANHCREIRDRIFSNPRALWQCDNYQVEH